MKWASNSIVVKFADQALTRYLVKGFSKIKNCQGVIALEGICYVVNCGQQLCFSGPFCPKAMLGVMQPEYHNPQSVSLCGCVCHAAFEGGPSQKN